MKNTIITHLRRTAKAWVAVVVPLTAGIAAVALTDLSVETPGLLGVVLVAVAQWLAVYSKRNTA